MLRSLSGAYARTWTASTTAFRALASTAPTVASSSQSGIYQRVRDTLNGVHRSALVLNEPQLQEVTTNALEDLNCPFRIVCVGNFSTGKSTLINALLTQDVSEEGRGVTTANIHYIRYGAKTEKVSKQNGDIEVAVDSAWMRDNAIEIIDTPGVGADNTTHQKMTLEEVPHCDLFLLLANPTNMLSGKDERVLMETLGKAREVAVVINFIDHLSGEKEVEEVLKGVKNNTTKYLKNPVYMPVSAKKAKESAVLRRAGKVEEANKLWQESRFQTLTDYLDKLLKSDARKFIKLKAPLEGVAASLNAVSGGFTKKLEALRNDAQSLSSRGNTSGEISASFVRVAEQEMDRAKAQFLASADSMVSDLPGFRKAFFGSLALKERQHFSFISGLRERLNSVVRDAQLDLSRAHKQLLTDIKAIGDRNEALKPDMQRVLDEAARTEEPLSFDRTLLAQRVDKVMAESFDGNDHFKNFSIASFRRKVVGGAWAAQLLAVTGVLGTIGAGNYMHFGPTEYLAGVGAAVGVGAAGMAVSALRWRRVRKELSSSAMKVQQDISKGVSRELETAIAQASVPLRALATRAQDAVLREQARVLKAQEELGTQARAVQALQQEVSGPRH